MKTGIDVNDQTAAIEESNEHENGVADEEENFDDDTTYLNDGCVNVDPQTRTTPTIETSQATEK